MHALRGLTSQLSSKKADSTRQDLSYLIKAPIAPIKDLFTVENTKQLATSKLAKP